MVLDLAELLKIDRQGPTKVSKVAVEAQVFLYMQGDSST